MNKITSVLSLTSLLAFVCAAHAFDQAAFRSCMASESARMNRIITRQCDEAPNDQKNSCIEDAQKLQDQTMIAKQCTLFAAQKSGGVKDGEKQPGYGAGKNSGANAKPVCGLNDPDCSNTRPPQRGEDTASGRPPLNQHGDFNQDREQSQTRPQATGPSPATGPASPGAFQPGPEAESFQATERGGATFSDVTAAEIEADRDIARCASARSSASECCGNPLNCSDRLNGTDARSLSALNGLLANGPETGGLTDYCRQVNKLGQDSANLNSGLAGICAGSHSTCSSTCGDLARKYAAFLDQCPDCPSRGVYQNAHSNFVGAQSACDSLQGRSQQLAVSGLGASNNAAVAEYCGKVVGGSGNIPVNDQGKLSPFINHLLAYNCDANPNSPDCKAIPREPAGDSEGAGTSDRKKNSDFNSPDAAQGFRGYPTGRAPETQEPEAWWSIRPSAKSGAGGSAATAAQAAAASNMKNGKPKAAGDKTVEKGGQKKAHGKDASGADSSYGGLAPMHGSGSQFDNVDLRQFLPGGSRAAGRRLAGANEINPKEENIFIRISNKMMEKCRLGVLWQCR